MQRWKALLEGISVGGETDAADGKRASGGAARAAAKLFAGAKASKTAAAAESSAATVIPFDYDYMKGGKRGAPDRMPKLLAVHKQALEDIPNPSSRPVFLVWFVSFFFCFVLAVVSISVLTFTAPYRSDIRWADAWECI
jgi:hypothetical protein